MKSFALTLLILFSSSAMSSEGPKTKIEKFMERKGVALHLVHNRLGEYQSLDKKTIEVSGIKAKVIGEQGVTEGIEISITKSRNSKVVESSYVDYAEIAGLVSNLKAIWNFTPSESDDEIGILTVSTNSDFSVSLLELNEEQQQETEVKRLVFVTTGDAYQELNSLKNINKLDKIDGLAIIPLEGIKDLISILEKAINRNE